MTESNDTVYITDHGKIIAVLTTNKTIKTIYTNKGWKTVELPKVEQL